eukprot:COSAG06_NODE_11362_length_1521_cov_450.343882_3_plen_48_part_01
MRPDYQQHATLRQPEAELLENLGFVRTACEQAQGPESFADGDTLVPAV